MVGTAVPPALQLPWGTTREGSPVTLTPTSLEFLQLLFNNSGSGPGSVAWADITGKPVNITAFAALAGSANTIAYFTGVGTMALTAFTAFGRSLVGAASAAAAFGLVSPLTTKGDLLGFTSANVRVPVGADTYVLTADSGAAAGVSWQPGGGAASLVPFHPLTFYGALENGLHDDVAAINAWLADTTQHTVWVENTTATSTSTARDFMKRARGTGAFHLTATGDYVPAQFLWMTSLPTTGVLPFGTSNYNFSGDISRSDVRYTITGRLTPTGNIRKSLTSVYFEPVVTPHWEQLNNLSGWSGFTCRLTAGITAGALTCQVNSTDGILSGDSVGFIGPSGAITDTRAVNVIDGTTLTWTGGLSNNYPSVSRLTNGLRTMDPIHYMEVNHFGGGDSYAIVAIVNNSYAKTAGQVHWVETATVGLFGGSLSFGSNMVYGTGLEMQYIDNGHDVTVIADVESFSRTNQVGAGGTFWARDWSQSTGIDAGSGLICPIDVFYTMGGWARVAFDTTRLTLSGQTGDPSVQPWAQTALGHRWYMNGSVTPGGRGTDPAGVYASMYGNTPGDIYIGSGNDGSSDFMDLKIDRVGGSRIRIRPDSINMNNPVNFGSQIHVAGNLILASGGYLHTIGTSLYFYDGTTDHLIV